jgi:hypothetical protein
MSYGMAGMATQRTNEALNLSAVATACLASLDICRHFPTYNCCNRQLSIEGEVESRRSRTEEGFENG